MCDAPDMTEKCSKCGREFDDYSNASNIQASGYCNSCDWEDKE